MEYEIGGRPKNRARKIRKALTAAHDAAGRLPSSGMERSVCRSGEVPMGEVPADVEERLMAVDDRLERAGNRAERIKIVLDAIGFNPLIELTRLASMNKEAETLAHELRKIAKKGMQDEDDTELMDQIADYLVDLGNPKVSVDASKAICEYFYPKLKSSEIKQHVDMGITVTVQKYGGQV
jgi:hypothetical protein